MVQKNTGFGYSKTKKKQKSWTWKLLFLIIFILVLIFWWVKFFPSPIKFENTKVSIVKGDTIAKFYDKLDKNQILRLKIYIKRHPDQLPKIQEWTYILSWEYTNSSFLSHIAAGPDKTFISYTVLEWRSIYDIDADLTAKWYISEGEYISYITSSSKIAELSQRYDFFDSSLTSLEWFLYPDTYFLDDRSNLIRQLVSIQLNTFKSKVWSAHSSDFMNIKNTYWLSIYEAITLASIIEKEEKVDANKSTIAWIFYNRLKAWMLIWADITLCYWLSKPYSECTPNVIIKNLKDSNNEYNTRVNPGLTPTPIWNPTLSTIKAVLFPSKTNYYYYLHWADWSIHYAETNAQHEQNKKYL